MQRCVVAAFIPVHTHAGSGPRGAGGVSFSPMESAGISNIMMMATRQEVAFEIMLAVLWISSTSIWWTLKDCTTATPDSVHL